MTPEHHDTIGTIFVRTASLVIGWLGTIAIADVQAVVSLASACAILVYTVMQIRALHKREKGGGK
jgi:hypothetical protein